MLDFVPLARAGWQVGDGDGQAGLLSETLDLALPQAHPVAIAAAATRGNDKDPGLGIACFAQAIPPAPNTLDREGRCVGVDADIDPALVGGDVVDAIGRDLAKFRDLKVMHPNWLGLPLGTQFPATVLEVADQFFLLGVDRDGGRTCRDRCLYYRIDMLELGIAVGMARPFPGLPVGLTAVFQLP